METGVCRDCGDPYDPPENPEVTDYGYCSNCQSPENVLDAPVLALRNIGDLDAE
jgi:hypothetical protein